MKIYLQVNLINVPGGKTVSGQVIGEYVDQLRDNCSGAGITTIKNLVFREYEGQTCSGTVDVSLKRLFEGEKDNDSIQVLTGENFEEVQQLMLKLEKELVENEIPFRVTARLEPVELRLGETRQWFGIVAYR